MRSVAASNEESKGPSASTRGTHMQIEEEIKEEVSETVEHCLEV